MPVLGWHALSGNLETTAFVIKSGANVNAEFDGVDDMGMKFGIFTVSMVVCFPIFMKGLLYSVLKSYSY